MNEVINLNSVHLNYLEPLLKWRVMDLDSLRKECFCAPKYNNFYRIIRTLEKKKILESYKDPFNHKKYIYLTSFGESQLSLDENPTALSKETLIHDIKVSEIAKAMIELNWVNEVELEHKIQDKRNFKNTYKIIPDAILHGEKNGVGFKIALELELSRKNNQRIIEKADQYLNSSKFNNALYIFSKKSLMEKYIEILSERFGDDLLKRIMFFFDDRLVTTSSEIMNWEGIFKGKKMKLGDLFMKK